MLKAALVQKMVVLRGSLRYVVQIGLTGVANTIALINDVLIESSVSGRSIEKDETTVANNS